LALNKAVISFCFIIYVLVMSPVSGENLVISLSPLLAYCIFHTKALLGQVGACTHLYV